MLLIRTLRGLLAKITAIVGVAILLAGTALAAGPRWTTGSPYYSSNSGSPVIWYTPQPLYFTDPGDLSPYVNHAAADAMVSAAATTWNLPSASIVLAQGGSLNEHVSSANVYLGPSGPVFPADVQASNFNAKQIAVIYDTDGSVTDTLLGGGASDPGNCRQSAVTESVDGIYGSGQIVHALIILNGRCTGSAPAVQMEMKYRLIRAFGRILGLGWSQLNDNVFTGSPQPTTQQLMNWPIMHPIDVLCGPYAYQCMLQPFTLRTDDMASLISMYPVYSDGNGKFGSFDAAASVVGTLSFPNGQGMEGVLVSVRRYHFGPGYTDAFDVTSGVTGATFQQSAGNPVTPKGTSAAESSGRSDQNYEGYYSLGWIPIPTADYFDNLTLTTSAINPLYTGQYAVGPYVTSQVTPSGIPVTATATVVGRGYQNVGVNMTAISAASTCSSGGDGTVSSPLAAASTGSWSDTLCGYQHSAWSSLQIKAGRTLTLEVTGTDEQGYTTAAKMQPVLGVWDSNDSTTSLPTLASQPTPLNASTLGMTNLRVSNATARTMRIGIADQRGDGRPDYGYNARILYADSISPASLPANGGTVTISGMGFHPGNAVTVNGIAAAVSNWTANTITLVAPAITGPLAADVVVTDLSTGGQATMSGALTYSQTALPDVIAVVSKPADGGYVGSAASPAFKVQATLPDGTTPASGAGITVSSAAATFTACSGASTCTLVADSSGSISSGVTPTAPGIVTLTASVGAASVSTTFVAQAIPVDGLTVVSMPSGTVYATLPASAPFGVRVTLPGSTTAAAGVNVVVSASNAALGACSGAPTCTLIADSSGMISTVITPAAAGVVSLLATAGGGMVSASFGATALPADVLRVTSRPADGSYIGRTASSPFAVQVMLGDNATPASYAGVTLTAAGATLSACGAPTCVLTATATGSVSTAVIPSTAGTVSLTASAGGGTISTSFTSVAVPPDALDLVSKPADGSYVGRTAPTSFIVQVALGDTGAPAAGVSVTVRSTNGILNACAAATCTLVADSTGTISTTVTPSTPGTVSLTASAGGGTLSAAFLAAAIPPDTFTILTRPANGSYVGRMATLPFAFQVFSGETGAAASSVSVTITASGATLAACSGSSSCVLTADATGSISTTVTPSAVGTVSLSASAGGGSASTTFTAIAVPPNALHVITQPASGSYVGRTAALPFAVQVALGDTGGPATGASVTVTATNAVLNACGIATCILAADSTGTITTPVTPSAAGSVTLAASAGGGTVSTSFNAVVIPPDALHVVTQPLSGSYIGRASASAFTVQVALGDTGAPAAGVNVVVSASNAVLNACGAPTCTLTANASGSVSTTVTPSAAGAVTLNASAGGGTVGATFNAVVVPPDTLHLVSQPANNSYVGRPALASFAVQVALGDTGAAAAGVSVSFTATNASLNACGAATCTLTADATGTVFTTVTPSAVGAVLLSANAGGGITSASFNAVAVPPDAVHVVAKPADGSYVGTPAAIPFTVQVALGDTGAPAANLSVNVSAANATLNACAAATCTLTTDATGTVSTTVIPTAPGVVTLSAVAGGGTASGSFLAAAIPPDTLNIVARPADGAYVGRAATLPFSVQVLDGITGTPAAGASVVLAATGATLDACGGTSSCFLIADSAGTITTTLTPTHVGVVSLSASANGGTAGIFFNALSLPPDVLTVVTHPVDGSYAGRTALLPLTVQVALGDTGAPASSIAVVVSATNAIVNACGTATCTLTTDSTGTVSTTISPVAAGAVTLSATAAGGTVSASFNAVAVPPDSLHVVSKPANGSYAGRAALLPFAVQVAAGDTGAPAAGTTVTLSATNATLAGCLGASCTLTADLTGTITTTVTPSATGTVSLTASAGGGSVSTSFSAVSVPPDTLTVVTRPADGSYAGRAASLPFAVAVLLGDIGGPAPNAVVTLSATNATLGCGAATCALTADAAGAASTTVTPSVAGTVTLSASAGGGTMGTSFNAVAVPPDALHLVTRPADGSYAARAALVPLTIQVSLGDTGGPAVGANVTILAINATLGCGSSTCTLPADATGTISTTVNPNSVGTVSLTATAGGGTVSTSFTAAAVPPDSLQVVTAPPDNTYTGSPAVLPFAVSILLGDNGTPASGVSVIVSASDATLGACGLPTCTMTANSLGVIATTVTATAAGVVTLTASAGGGTVSANFTAITSPDNLQILSAPSDHSIINQTAALPFTVRATLGFTSNARFHALVALQPGSPDIGQAITLTAVGGKLNACGLPTCVLTTDSAGTVSSTVTPILPGPVTLLAAGGGGTASNVFAADTPPDTIQTTSTPANGSYANRVASAPFAVQVLLGDGVTPAVAVSTTLSAANATFGVCGLPSCVVLTNASGIVSTPVTPSAVGVVQLTVSAAGVTTTTSFTSSNVPPDTLHVTAQPANRSYVARAASTPFTVQALLGDTGGPASGASVTVNAVNATLNACGLSTCTLTADSTGSVSTTITPTAAGTIQLTATAGGGTTSTSFTAAAVPPDTLQVTSHPANGSYTGRVSAAPFTVQVNLGDTGGPAAGVAVTLSASNATFSACPSTPCTLTADGTGTISTAVTPSSFGAVTLTASAGGGTISTTFTSAAVPPDFLQVLAQPADGSYAGSVAATRFAIQIFLGDTGAPAAGASVTVTTANATFGACSASTCILTADPAGEISTTVNPLAAGIVNLTAAAGGGTVSSSFLAAPAPVDSLRIVSQPPNSAYATLPAAAPLTVQVMLPDGRTPASNVAATLSATHATLGSCGGSASCVLTTDASGTVTTMVTPQQPGVVTLNASSGGGTVSTTFTALALPANIVTIVSAPAAPVYLGVVAANRLAVHVLLGDGITPAPAAPVALTASGAIFGSCTSSCTLTTDTSGNAYATVTPTASGNVTLTAASGGGTASASFTVTPDVLRVISSPANNSYTGSPAASPYAVQVLLGDGTTPVAGAAVTVTSSSATLGACSLYSCILTTDGQGTGSTLVTAIAPGTVTLTAVFNGVSTPTSFNAVAPPNTLQVLSSPANDSYAGSASVLPFTVLVSPGTVTNHASGTAAVPNTAIPVVPGVTVTLSASGATLDACGHSSCTLTTGPSGTVSTTVTPVAAGTVTLSATVGGATISSTFTAANPPDVLHIISLPANGSYFGRTASAPLAIKVMRGDGTTPAAGVTVSVTASSATFGACGQLTCNLLSDSTGTVSTSVTPSTAGTVSLTATAEGGATSASFTAVAPPDSLSITSAPSNGAYTGRAAAVPFAIRVLLGDGITPASGALVTLTAANAILGACGASTCTSTADSNGIVSTTVSPALAGGVTLSASAAGGSVSTAFTAIDPVRTIAFSRPTEYVAVGSTVTWTPTVTLLENGVPVTGMPVTWTSHATGLALGSYTSSSNSAGVASLNVIIGPLASGAVSSGTACAWTHVCATFTAQSVDPSAWRLVAVSGDVQSVSPAATFQPLTIRALDDAGDWIAGVEVQVNQIVRGWVACPTLGRCPLGPVLSTATSTLVSDADGLASIRPAEILDNAETTGIVAVAGPYGFCSVSVSKIP